MSVKRPCGLILLYKESGVTSFDSLGALKKAFATGKAGHTGTLDKFAEGLLLVLVGSAVKLNFLFEGLTKDYTGTIIFGEETDTLDPEGAVIATASPPSRERVEAALDNFRGDILQAPPAYSALHINGRRAHELAREGMAPEMKKRPVTVHELEIISWSPMETVIHAKVSAGTYIRSLARDLALAAGSRGHLSALKRTKVGPFCLEDAFSFAARSEITEDRLLKVLRPPDPNLFDTLSLPCIFLDEKSKNDFIHGRPLDQLLKLASSVSAAGDNCTAGVFGEKDPGDLLGVVSCRNGNWSYVHVFANN